MSLPARHIAFGRSPSNRWEPTELPVEPELHSRFTGSCLMHSPRPQREMLVSEDPSDLAQVFVSFVRDISAKVETDLRIGILEKVVLEMRHVIGELAGQKTILVPITSLAPEALRLQQPIFVVVQPDGDQFSATFFDANINASGDTQTEAVENLKEILISSFRRFTELGESRLGPGPRQQLAVLKSIIKIRE